MIACVWCILYRFVFASAAAFAGFAKGNAHCMNQMIRKTNKLNLFDVEFACTNSNPMECVEIVELSQCTTNFRRAAYSRLKIVSVETHDKWTSAMGIQRMCLCSFYISFADGFKPITVHAIDWGGNFKGCKIVFKLRKYDYFKKYFFVSNDLPYVKMSVNVKIQTMTALNNRKHSAFGNCNEPNSLCFC